MSNARPAGRASELSLRQLRLFETIGDLKSVRRAAEECGVSQPAVTQALAKLEDVIGAPLVDRRASGSYLNALGEILHARVKRFFAHTERAVLETGAAASQASARATVNRLTRSQIRTLLSTIEHGSFEAAAAAIGISTASLLRAARDLDGNLRMSLFYRTAAGLLVGPHGLRFGTRMKLAFQEIDLGVDEIDAALGSGGRQIVIGAMPFGGSVLLASVLDEFLQRHRHADIRIISDGAAAMAKSLRAGDVDFVIGLLPEVDVDELATEALAQTPYSVVARLGHPLLQKGKLSVEDLRGCEWVVGEVGSSRRRCFEGLFDGDTRPQAQIATCVAPVIRQLVERSDRLTLMTSYELQYAEGRLRALPVGTILPIPSMGFTMRADWLPTRLHTDFLDLVRAHVAIPAERLPLRQVG
jgi:LysR family transcriptional regulator of gallate degradation